MPVFIALLQGVNIGSKKRITMADLRSRVESLGATSVKTYVNSGNVVFASNSPATRIQRDLEAAVSDHVGVDIPVVIRSASEWDTIVANNPWPTEADDNPKAVHLQCHPNPIDESAVASILDGYNGDDRVEIAGRDMYLLLPNLVSGSTLPWKKLTFENVNHGTSRNWATVLKLQALSTEISGEG